MNDYPVPEPCCVSNSDVPAKMCIEHHDTLTERLVQRKFRLESELNDINQALQQMKDNPQVAQTIDSITRVFGNNLR